MKNTSRSIWIWVASNCFKAVLGFYGERQAKSQGALCRGLKKPMGYESSLRIELVPSFSACRSVCVAALFGSLLSQLTFAQNEDPFAVGRPLTEPTSAIPNSGSAPIGASSTGDSTNSVIAPRETNLVVLSLRSNPPKTSAEFARALVQLNRIGRFDEAGQLLDKLAANSISESQATAMVREIGTAGLLAIRGNTSKYSPAQIAVLEQVLQGAAGAVRNEQVLDAHYRKLHSDSVVAQKQALLGIQSAGADGLAYFLSSAMTDEVPANHAMLATLNGFGSLGTEALRAALVTNDSAKRERLLVLSSQNTQGDLLPEIISIAAASPQSSTSHALASELLQAMGSPQANTNDVFLWLIKRLETQLVQYRESLSQSPQLQMEHWRLVGPEERLKSELAPRSQVELERSSQLARCVLRVALAANRQSPVATATLLEYQYRIDPQFSTEDPLQILRNGVPDSELRSSEFLCSTWDAAVKNQFPAAQLRLIQQIQSLSPEEVGISKPLIERLVTAIRSPSPPVRYAAALALAPLGPIQPYAGSNRTAQMLNEMAHLDSRPLTLVVGGNSQLRNRAVQLVEQLGGRCIEAVNAREVFRFAEQPQPVERVLIVHRVIEMGLGQLVDRMQTHYRFQGIPISVLSSDLTAGEVALLNDHSNVKLGSVPSALDGMAFVFEQGDLFDNSLPIASSDRIAWQTTASELLERAAN